MNHAFNKLCQENCMEVAINSAQCAEDGCKEEEEKYDFNTFRPDSFNKTPF